MIKLMHGDCLDLMKDIPDGSVDAIITDPPYETTACTWDSIIPFKPMWAHLKRVIKPNGAIVLMASQPFTTGLIASNMKMFKYCWVWDKKIPSGMSYARFQPMRQSEDVVVFCGGKTKYNPQMSLRNEIAKSGGTKYSPTAPISNKDPNFKKTYTHKNPVNIIKFSKVRQGSINSTQKPVPLMEYLINTYTDKGEVVLDFAMGSGTTGVACLNIGRKFIGIEKRAIAFKQASDRIEKHKKLTDSYLI